MLSPQRYAPTGDLTIATVAEFRTALVDMISDEKSGMLDLGAVRRVDVAALQVMIAAERTGRISLRNLSQPVGKAMETIGFTPASAPNDHDAHSKARERKTTRDMKR